jgi:hypothetical protein
MQKIIFFRLNNDLVFNFCRPLDSAAQGGFTAPSVATPMGPSHYGRILGPDSNPSLSDVNSSARSITMFGILLYVALSTLWRIEINLNYIKDFSFTTA